MPAARWWLGPRLRLQARSSAAQVINAVQRRRLGWKPRRAVHRSARDLPVVEGEQRLVVIRDRLKGLCATGRGGREAVDVALEFSTGEPATASDVDRTQVPMLHQGVHGGS